MGQRVWAWGTYPASAALAALAALATVTALGLAACSDDGRELRPPAPGATAPPRSTSSAVAPPALETPDDLATAAFTLSSPAFGPGEPIPERLTCEGEDRSPALVWQGVPPGAVELAVTVLDLDADGFVHWVLSGLDPLTTGLAEGELPEGAVAGLNRAGQAGWLGPCPPGGGSHRYVFTLHALPTPSGLEVGTPAAEAVARIEGLATGRATLTGVFPPP